MKLSNRIFGNPDVGTYNHRQQVTYMDSISSVIPTNPLKGDGVTLSDGDRVLYVGLSDPALNNRIYKAQKQAGTLVAVLAKDGRSLNGDSLDGDTVYVQSGSHGGELWSFDGAKWDQLSVDVDSEDDLQEEFLYPIDAGTTPAMIGKLFHKDGGDGIGFQRSEAIIADENIGFVAEQPAQPATAELTVNEIFKTALNATQGFANLVFLTQPNSGDGLHFFVNNQLTFSYVNSITNPANEVLIGATIADTVQNTKDYLDLAIPAFLPPNIYDTAIIAPDTLRISNNPITRPGSKGSKGIPIGSTPSVRILPAPTANNGRLKIDYVAEGSHYDPVNGYIYLSNGEDGYSGELNSVSIQYLLQPLVGSGVTCPFGQFIFGTPGPNGGWTQVAIGASLTDTVDNLFAAMDANASAEHPPTRSLIRVSPDTIKIEALIEHNFGPYNVNSFRPQMRIVTGFDIFSNPLFSQSTSEAQVLNGDGSGNGLGFVEGVANVAANAVVFYDSLHGLAETVTVGIDFAIGSDVEDQRDLLFDALEAVAAHTELQLTKVSTNKIAALHTAPGFIGSWGFQPTGGLGSEANQNANYQGADIQPENPGYAARPFGKLMAISGNMGVFRPVIGNTFEAYEDIPEGSPLAAGPEGKMRIGDTNVDWIAGKAQRAVKAGDKVRVAYLSTFPNNWQQPSPSSREEALERMMQFIIQNFGAP